MDNNYWGCARNIFVAWIFHPDVVIGINEHRESNAVSYSRDQKDFTIEDNPTNFAACHVKRSKFFKEGIHYCPIRKQLDKNYYGHGGFFGMGPLMLSEDKWFNVLNKISPDTTLLFFMGKKNEDKTGNLEDIIKGFENNPVVSAFSLASTEKESRKDMVFEWDIFFSSTLDFTKADWPDNILIAHGKPTHLKMEQVNLNSFSRVKKLHRTALGGVTLRTWLTEFIRAIKISEGRGDRNVVSMDDLTGVYNDFVGSDKKFRVVLDIKTGNYGKGATPEKISTFVRKLMSIGISVEGVGSFDSKQLNFNGNVPKVLFFHGLNAHKIPRMMGFVGKQFLQVKNIDSHIDVVMFNIGFLLEDEFKINEEALKEVKEKKEAINRLREKKIKLGVYTQEYSVGMEPLKSMIKIISENSDIFENGFAWGGSPKFWYKSMENDGRAAQDYLALNNEQVYDKISSKLEENNFQIDKELCDHTGINCEFITDGQGGGTGGGGGGGHL